jgi:glutamate decarboxylase
VQTLSYAFASRHMIEAVPKFRLPEHGMPAAIAKQLVEDERQLDANPRQNLASFVTTWMEPEAQALYASAANVNAVDIEQYPSSTEFEQRCLAMLGDLFNAPPQSSGSVVGCATIGSSEAIMLACLAMKRRWQTRRRDAGLSVDHPNLVMGHNVQVCWEKACRYFEIEPRYVDLTDDCFVLTPAGAAAACDECTIGVCAIVGSTYNGAFEDVAGICEALAAVNAKHGWDVNVHVDGASGGWVAAFLYPELKWDFRNELVCSISVSGHKYGELIALAAMLHF